MPNVSLRPKTPSSAPATDPAALLHEATPTLTPPRRPLPPGTKLDSQTVEQLIRSGVLQPLDEAPPPPDPRPLPEPVPLESLSGEQQQAVRQAIQEVMAAHQAAAESPPPPRPAPAEPPPPPPPSRPAADEPSPSSTGVTAPPLPQLCPHCGWDLSLPHDIEVTDADKVLFVESLLAERPFQKEYELLGGRMTVTFRALTGAELDTIFAQCFHERATGELKSEFDFYERVNRYRAFLQLVSLRSDRFLHEFPEGFTKETNPHAATHYELPESLDPRETGLRLVADYVVTTALKTETLMRVVLAKCRQFNRLLAHLEAMADNADFFSSIR